MKRSSYARKQARKRGNGARSAAWMWWCENSDKPRRIAL